MLDSLSIVKKLFRCPKCKGSFVLNGSVLECNQCRASYPIKNDIYFINNKLKKKDIKLSQKSWEKIYKEEDKSFSLSEAEKNIYVKAYLKFVKKEDIKEYFVDLGSGLGLMALVVSKKFRKIPILIDFSPQALFLSKKIFEKNKVKGIFICADVTSDIYKENSFQYFFSSMSLEYFKNLTSAFKLLNKALSKNGKLTFIIPKISITTLTYHQFRSGDIPDLPIIRSIYEIIHLKLLKGRRLKTGYNVSYRIGKIKKVAVETGFNISQYGDLKMNYQLAFIKSRLLKKLGLLLVKNSWFSPLMFFVIKK